MFFLSSLPRSGSTLLTSLLNQRPDTYASPTSNLCDTMGAAVMAWEQNPTTKASGGNQNDLIRVLKGIAESRYDIDKMVFDKSRGWPAPQIMQTMKMVQGDMKIVATVRPIAECLASLVKIAKPENVTAFCKNSGLAKHLFDTYRTLKAGYEAAPGNFLLVEYDDLVKDTQGQMDRIAEFVGTDAFVHDLADVPDSGEKDEVWGVKDLHKVRRRVSKRRYSARRVLGDELFNFYQGGEFWNDKPELVRRPTVISLQHKTLMRGDFAKSRKMAYANLKANPDNNDMAFNAGWAKLSEGKVQEGYRLLDRGRVNMVWGDPPCGSIMPVWEGQRDATVLLRLERGLGDQIHQARYARDLEEHGCTVIVSCAPELAPVLRYADGVDVVVQHEAACGVLHDFHIPAMSAPIQLGLTQETIRGPAYIPRSQSLVPGRVGLRWQGNPAYEHATKRLFPPELLFDTMKGQDCISLQKGEGEELRPRWVKKVTLDTWADTAKAIASCELVITSCTAVAHLAGAMSVETWNVVPLVPYYLWTWPGEKTPYYDTMTLFRQTEVDNWNAPFQQIKEQLEMCHAA